MEQESEEVQKDIKIKYRYIKIPLKIYEIYVDI